MLLSRFEELWCLPMAWTRSASVPISIQQIGSQFRMGDTENNPLGLAKWHGGMHKHMDGRGTG